jgi:flagellar L-ring protein precursor FlgH
MLRRFSLVAAGAICLSVVLCACSSVEPSSITAEQRSARPKNPAPVALANGTIFNSETFRPMFEDRRARSVGDLITILISEKASADNKAANNSVKVGSMNSRVGSLPGLPTDINSFLSGHLSTQANGSSQYDNKAAGSASYTFLSTLGVTVTEVLSNGNLVVSGEKQIGLDKGVEFIRFSGVINPNAIGQGNVISSSQVADARIEYRTNTQVDRSQLATMLNRFFFSVMPL